MTQIAIIGEAMLELSHPQGQGARLAFGGDTLNTALYLARLGAAPHYITALGNDPYSEGLLREWQRECIQTNHVLIHPSRLPGLYAIQTDHLGERRFFYWREASAARAFFECEGAQAALDFAAQSDWLYVSGITLSLFDKDRRARLADVAAKVKSRGGQVVFDPNYRPRGWASHEAARSAFDAFCEHVTLALPTIDDENVLQGQKRGDDHAARWHALGIRTLVLKCGPQGALLYRQGEETVRIPVPETIKPVDTTGAGDSFNAGFLAAASRGQSLENAIRTGNQLAGAVIRHPGAIIPREAMPALERASS